MTLALPLGKTIFLIIIIFSKRDERRDYKFYSEQAKKQITIGVLFEEPISNEFFSTKIGINIMFQKEEKKVEKKSVPFTFIGSEGIFDIIIQSVNVQEGIYFLSITNKINDIGKFKNLTYKIIANQGGTITLPVFANYSNILEVNQEENFVVQTQFKEGAMVVYEICNCLGSFLSFVPETKYTFESSCKVF